MIALSDPTQAPGRPAVPADAPTEAIGDEIARLSAHLNAATYQLLVLIRDFDQREGWANGFLSCAHWLAWRTGISARPAREKVRVARALAPLDRISEAMANGTLSYSKVRALTRVATPENEEDLLDVARHATAAQLEKLVRAWRRVEDLNDPSKEEQRHQRRFLRVYQDDDGSYRIQGRLDPEVGAVFEKALEWANEALYQEDSETAFQHRMADGLGLVAERALAADGALAGEGVWAAEGASDGDGALAMDEGQPADRSPTGDKPREKPRPVSRADRFQVVVHVGADELGGRAPSPSATGSGSAEPRRSKPNREGSEAEPTARGSAEPGESRGRSQAAVPTASGSAEPQRNEGRPGRRLPAVLNTPGTLAFLPRETSRRLSCDAGLVVMTHAGDGGVLDVGRKSRTVPPPIRRALDARDGGCRFPGCECRYTQAHHIEHWARGGETKLDNLILLCPRHHRALHEGGFQVRRLASQGGAQRRGARAGDDVQFFSPTGELILAVPEDPPLWRAFVNPVNPVGRVYPVDRGESAAQSNSVDQGDPVTLRGQRDPVRELVARNSEAGIAPDAWTPTPLWNGEPMDLSLAVDMFLGMGGPENQGDLD